MKQARRTLAVLALALATLPSNPVLAGSEGEPLEDGGKKLVTAEYFAEVSVLHAHECRSMTDRGSDPYTLVASAKAYLGALNKIVMKRQRDTVNTAAAS